MSTMTFQINDASTDGSNPAVWVTITENPDGTLSFNVTQQGGIVGDLRGIFFDIADESILKSLVVTAASTDIRIGDDSIRDLGDGANMNGLLGSDKGYDVGIEIGTSGIGKDDIRSYSFTLDSSARDLTLADFANVDFAARLTSVGVVGGARADSSKLLELTSQAIDARSDLVATDENSATSGNVLANDATGGGTNTVTGWSGGALGATVSLASEGDLIGTLRFNADGSYVLDGSAGDELSEGEHIAYNFNYGVRNQTEATSWSDDTASLSVVINGRNDGPVANDDAAGSVAEDGVLAGSVTANDSDVDRLDTHTWALVDGSFDGQGKLSMNADGSWSFDADGAYDYLNDGESVEVSFQYAMTDNHGASDLATVTFRVEGSGTVEPPPPPPSSDVFPTMSQAISNVVLYLDDGDSSTALQKVKLSPTMSLYDVDGLKIGEFIDTHGGEGSVLGANTQLVGISVHAGQEYPNLNDVDGTKPGEGAFFFLMDGETPIVEAIGTRSAEGGWAFDWGNDDYPLSPDALAAGFSNELLNAPAQDFAFTGEWT